MAKVNLLNNIHQGSLLTFDVAPEGKVLDIWSSVGDSKGGFSQLRLNVQHKNGEESYHTYRHDGRSCHDSDYDIKEVINNG